jgi:hypothetical protein
MYNGHDTNACMYISVFLHCCREARSRCRTPARGGGLEGGIPDACAVGSKLEVRKSHDIDIYIYIY